MIIDRINEAIDLEYDAKNEEIDNLSELPLAERIVKGDTIADITASFESIAVGEKSFIFRDVTIKCEKPNLSKYREGSPVVLSKGQYQFKLDVEEDGGRELRLASGYHDYELPYSENETSGWQLNPAKVDIRHIVKKTSSYLDRFSDQRAYVSRILEGELMPKHCPTRAKRAEELVENYNLNSTQAAAFVRAFSTENYYLVQGPPGSGKTWLLAHLAKAFADEGKKVLITAFTHTAINNALQKTSVLTNHPHIVKVGKRYQMENLDYQGAVVRNIPAFHRSEYHNGSSGIIVGATCYSPCTKKLEFMDWDVVIFDEAGQLTVPLAVSAMARGKKFIFIGDHQQLSPIIPEKQKDPIFSKSIFALLHRHAPGIMLDTTYRMNTAINALPSKLFYEGRLKADSTCANRILSPDLVSDRHQDLLAPDQPEVLFLHNRFSQDTRSSFEADLAAECTKELINGGVSPAEIAIITPFRAQVRMIKSALKEIGVSSQERKMLLVDTVERIQGQERDVVIISMGTSNPMKANQRAAFFYNGNRLNVALTRARKKRIVLAHHEVFDPPSIPEEIQSLVQVFKTFKDQSFVIREWDEVGEDLF